MPVAMPVAGNSVQMTENINRLQSVLLHLQTENRAAEASLQTENRAAEASL
jgi:hypothetical protein